MTKQQPKPIWHWALVGVAHLLGVLVLAGLGSLMFFDEALRQLFWLAWREGTLTIDLAKGLGLHVGIASLAWALVCGWVVRWRKHVAKPARVVLSRGSVMLETLIVLPVALFLIFGLAQLAVINMAGVLANLATFEAARAAWLWDGERDRFDMDDQLVGGMARVQAAAVLTPVVPSTFAGATQDLPVDAEVARQMRGIMVGSQLPYVTWNLDAQGRSMADRVIAVQQPATDSFLQAFDSQSFIERSVRKFSLAYRSTEVEMRTTQERVGVRVVYEHHCVFPVVAGLFGERKVIAQIDGFFMTIEREFDYPRQVAAHPEWPKSSDWIHGEPVHTTDFF